MINYKPLFRLLLERDMTKTQLREAVGFSPATLAKMSKGEYVSLETVENICKYLNCRVEDVIEIQPWNIFSTYIFSKSDLVCLNNI